MIDKFNAPHISPFLRSRLDLDPSNQELFFRSRMEQVWFTQQCIIQFIFTPHSVTLLQAKTPELQQNLTATLTTEVSQKERFVPFAELTAEQSTERLQLQFIAHSFGLLAEAERAEISRQLYATLLKTEPTTNQLNRVLAVILIIDPSLNTLLSCIQNVHETSISIQTAFPPHTAAHSRSPEVVERNNSVTRFTVTINKLIALLHQETTSETSEHPTFSELFDEEGTSFTDNLAAIMVFVWTRFYHNSDRVDYYIPEKNYERHDAALAARQRLSHEQLPIVTFLNRDARSGVGHDLMIIADADRQEWQTEHELLLVTAKRAMQSYQVHKYYSHERTRKYVERFATEAETLVDSGVMLKAEEVSDLFVMLSVLEKKLREEAYKSENDRSKILGLAAEIDGLYLKIATIIEKIQAEPTQKAIIYRVLFSAMTSSGFEDESRPIGDTLLQSVGMRVGRDLTIHASFPHKDRLLQTAAGHLDDISTTELMSTIRTATKSSRYSVQNLTQATLEYAVASGNKAFLSASIDGNPTWLELAKAYTRFSDLQHFSSQDAFLHELFKVVYEVETNPENSTIIIEQIARALGKTFLDKDIHEWGIFTPFKESILAFWSAEHKKDVVAWFTARISSLYAHTILVDVHMGDAQQTQHVQNVEVVVHSLDNGITSVLYSNHRYIALTKEDISPELLELAQEAIARITKNPQLYTDKTLDSLFTIMYTYFPPDMTNKLKLVVSYQRVIASRGRTLEIPGKNVRQYTLEYLRTARSEQILGYVLDGKITPELALNHLCIRAIEPSQDQPISLRYLVELPDFQVVLRQVLNTLFAQLPTKTKVSKMPALTEDLRAVFGYIAAQPLLLTVATTIATSMQKKTKFFKLLELSATPKVG